MEFQNFLKINNLTSFEAIKSTVESEQYKLRVKESDLYPSLYLVCQTEESDNSIPFVRECNGIILEKETNKIVCYSFEKSEDMENINPKINLNESRFDISIDGVLIRVYNYNGVWMISTKKCIDAKKARWLTNKSFHEMFEEVFPTEKIANMDVNDCYTFILCHPDNNMVVKYDSPRLYHIATRNMTTFQEYEKDIGIEQSPKQMIVNGDVSVLNQMMTSPNLNYEGYILVDSTYKRQKFSSPYYKRAREVWGNTNNRFYRFCEIRKEGPVLMEEYIKYFPQDTNDFLKYETKIVDFGKKVFETYQDRHVRRKQINIPQHLKRVIYDIHGDFLKNRQMTDMVKIMQWISNYDAKLLVHLINQDESSQRGEVSENQNHEMVEDEMKEETMV
jgi:hypothetical protein